MASDFVNLHSHTIYSVLDGFGTIKDYVQEAARLKMPALAITDHGNTHGWMDFYQEAVNVGVKPILGSEMYQARVHRLNREPIELSGGATDEFSQKGPHHLTVLAQNKVGYHNVIKLSSLAYTEGFYGKPRIDHELIEKYCEGVIFLSGCLNGEVAQALMRDDFDAALKLAGNMRDRVGKDNYFIEIMDHGIEEELKVLPDLIRIAKMIGVRAVPTGDSHYVRKEDSKFHDVYLAVSTGATLAQENRFKFVPDEFYLKSDKDMAERFDIQLVKNSLYVAEMVEDLNLTFDEHYFPDFPLPQGYTVDSYLREQVEIGMRKRYGPDPSREVLDRVEHEMRVIKTMGFQSYFLVVSDLVNWAKEQNIRVGYGRGSAAGSIISYILSITNLEPLKFGLMFERFLVEGRKSMPDIDLDFDDRHRDKVIEYAKNLYGENNVAHIGTFSTIKAKSAIKDAGRVLGHDFQTTNMVSKLVPPPVLGVTKSVQESKETRQYAEAYSSNAAVREITDNAVGLEGLIRQTGTHAAGVIITQRPVIDYIPIMQRHSGDESGPFTSQWPMDWVEKNGLLKVDFLGLANLAVIDICVENVRKRKGIYIDTDEVPLDDKKTYEDLCNGNGSGIFQLASSGMQSMMMALRPDRIEDIMALIALYRPGPLGSGMDKVFIARKHGRAADASRHPLMDDLLEDTYGIMLYQENVLKIAKEMAGFDPGECDDLRKAVGKKQMDKIPLFREKFVEGCISYSNVNGDVANQIFTDIEYHGGYSFNLSHSASYAMVSYLTAYLKSNHGPDYMAALLTHSKNKEKAAPMLHECRRMDLSVLPPSINRSQRDFTVVDDETILFGLESISGIGEAKVEKLLAPRGEDSYENIYDFFRRADKESLNKGSLEHLVRSGALDELAFKQENRVLDRKDKRGLLDMERNELGLYISDHPLTNIWHYLEQDVDCNIEDLQEQFDGSTVKVCGVITKVINKTTKSGNPMKILTVEDLTDTVEVLVFHTSIDRIDDPEPGDIFYIVGRLQHEGDEDNPVCKMILFEGIAPELPETIANVPIILYYPNEQPNKDHIQDLYRTVKANPGNTPVYLKMHEEDKTVTIKFKDMCNVGIKNELTRFRSEYVL